MVKMCFFDSTAFFASHSTFDACLQHIFFSRCSLDVYLAGIFFFCAFLICVYAIRLGALARTQAEIDPCRRWEGNTHTRTHKKDGIAKSVFPCYE